MKKLNQGELRELLSYCKQNGYWLEIEGEVTLTKKPQVCCKSRKTYLEGALARAETEKQTQFVTELLTRQPLRMTLRQKDWLEFISGKPWRWLWRWSRKSWKRYKEVE